MTLDRNGILWNISVNSYPGTLVEELARGMPHRHIGVTTVEAVRAAGGTITPDPLPDNPYHHLVGGITPEAAAQLFTPTLAHPTRSI